MFKNFKLFLYTLIIIIISACGGGSGSSDTPSEIPPTAEQGTGYFRFYNAANNSSPVFINVADKNDIDFSGSGFDYGEAEAKELVEGNYHFKLAWQESNGYDIFSEESLKIQKNLNYLIVLTSVSEDNVPDIVGYEYEDELEGIQDDEFSIRFMNLFSDDVGVDIYYSLDNETFADAKLFSTNGYIYKEMTESMTLKRDNYVFYITAANSDEVLYESEEQYFSYRSQYMMFIRENTGPGESPYTMDKMFINGGVTEYPDIDDSPELRFYNGIIGDDELLPTYNDSIDLSIMDAYGEETMIKDLVQGELSEIHNAVKGEVFLNLHLAGEPEPIDEDYYLNHLANDDLTYFLFSTITTSGEDDREIAFHMLSVKNSPKVSQSEHKITLINLVDDYSILRVTFIRSYEDLQTAPNFMTSKRLEHQSMNLRNDVYTVQVVCVTSSSTIKTLATEVLILDTNSKDMFLIIEGNERDAFDNSDVSQELDYKIKFIEQQ